MPKNPLENTFSRQLRNEPVLRFYKKKSSTIEDVFWAEESKNGLRFEIGPSYDAVPTRSKLVTHRQSSCTRPGSSITSAWSTLAETLHNISSTGRVSFCSIRNWFPNKNAVRPLQDLCWTTPSGSCSTIHPCQRALVHMPGSRRQLRRGPRRLPFFEAL